MRYKSIDELKLIGYHPNKWISLTARIEMLPLTMYYVLWHKYYDIFRPYSEHSTRLFDK